MFPRGLTSRGTGRRVLLSRALPAFFVSLALLVAVGCDFDTAAKKTIFGLNEVQYGAFNALKEARAKTIAAGIRIIRGGSPSAALLAAAEANGVARERGRVLALIAAEQSSAAQLMASEPLLAEWRKAFDHVALAVADVGRCEAVWAGAEAPRGGVGALSLIAAVAAQARRSSTSFLSAFAPAVFSFLCPPAAARAGVGALRPRWSAAPRR